MFVAGRGAMRMRREQFLDLESEPWWLLERELDPALEERRRSLGQCWGWTDLQWYADPRKLEELYSVPGTDSAGPAARPG